MLTRIPRVMSESWGRPADLSLDASAINTTLTFGKKLTPQSVAPHQDHRTGDKDRRIDAGNKPHQQGKGERPDHRAAEKIKCRQHQQSRARGKYRSAQRLV